MISIIICSRDEQEFKNVSVNIGDTIGVEHEIVRIDNSKNTYSISKAYNYGASISKYDLLCFVHEDVIFKTSEWGKILAVILADTKIGLVGVVGGIIKTKSTGPTWWSPVDDTARMNLIQCSDEDQQLLYKNPNKELLSEVVAIDGVFMACTKETWKEVKFDEKNIQGFHFYDLDFSLTVGIKKKVVVSYEILLEHFSKGKNDIHWALQADIVHSKWRASLPKSIGKIKPSILSKIESGTQDFYLNNLYENKASIFLIFKYLIKRIQTNPFDIWGNLFFLRKLF